MKRYTPADIEALTNHDGLLQKPPWENDTQKCQYYAHFIERMLWRYFSEEDWSNIAEIISDLRVQEKLLRTTRFLLRRRMEL